jgi:hypothetical protein
MIFRDVGAMILKYVESYKLGLSPMLNAVRQNTTLLLLYQICYTVVIKEITFLVYGCFYHHTSRAYNQVYFGNLNTVEAYFSTLNMAADYTTSSYKTVNFIIVASNT